MTRSVSSGKPRPEAPERGRAAGDSPLIWMLISRLRARADQYLMDRLRENPRASSPVSTARSSADGRKLRPERRMPMN